jgi:predicted ATP-grasp superfamily ATP-dependent carboligase
VNIHVPSELAPSIPVVRSGVRGALVLGGMHGSLAAARSLGRHGIPVWLLSDDVSIARFSRYAHGSLRWRGPAHPEALQSLLALARLHRLEGYVLFAASDADARFIAQNHAALSTIFVLTVPPWDTLASAYDKRRMNERAAAVGVDTPWTAFPRNEKDVAALNCRFPAVLKPTVHASRNAFTQAKAWRVDDSATLLARYREAAALVGEDAIMLQGLIPGNGTAQFSYAAVWDRGRPVASLVARRTRQYPINFGYTSTFVETIVQNEIEDAAVRFLSSLDYHGLVEIEFKYDARDRRYKILDVNARIWTWIALGAAAGVDFPFLMWSLATKGPLPSSQARTGIAWMHASRDFVAACQEIYAGSLSVADYAHSLRKQTTFAAFASDDPVPGALDLPLVGWRLLARLASSRATRG